MRNLIRDALAIGALVMLIGATALWFGNTAAHVLASPNSTHAYPMPTPDPNPQAGR